MANNLIEIYQQNSTTITCDVSGITDLINYSGILTVKTNADGEIVISSTGTISDLKVTFELSYTDTSIAADDYVYDVVVESSVNKYTVVQDTFKVLNSVKF